MKLAIAVLFLISLFALPATLSAQCARGSGTIRGAILRGDGPVRRVIRAKPIRSRLGLLLPRNRI